MIEVKQGDRKVQYVYNDAISRGQLSKVIHADGKETRFEYDVMGRLRKTHYPDGNSTAVHYDNNGNSTELTVPTAASHTFAYNGVNKVKSTQAPGSKPTQYHYDRDRRLTAITLPSGQRIEYHYENGRHVRTQTPEGTLHYQYQNGNQLRRMHQGDESIQYRYDGTLLTEVAYQGELNQLIKYGYNADFNVNTLSYAGQQTQLSYDGDKLLTGVHGFEIQRHSEHGLPTSMKRDGYEQQRAYNDYGEASEINHQQGGVALKQQLSYNKVGQIVQKIEVVSGTRQAATRTYDYQYDDKQRLTQVKLNDQVVEAYRYDANGNRILTTSTERQVSQQIASYNQGDQLQQAGNQSYEYDDNGRLKRKVRRTDDGANVVTQYQYDSQGRLLKVITPAKTVEYRHNAFGNRVAKLINGEIVEKYLWQNKTTLLATYDGNGELKQRFEYTLGHAPTAFTQNGERYYLLTDQLGSPRIVTNSAGSVVKEIRYDSYGNVLEDSNPEFELPFGFAGGLYDVDTGLLRFGYRDFDPETGRWTARDPIGFAGGDTNLYGYVLGDPINAVDPTGLWLFAAPGAKAALDSAITALATVIAAIGTEVLTQDIAEGESEGDSCPGGGGGWTPDPEDIPDFDWDDPTKPPVDAEGNEWPWREPDEPGGKRGGYVNPKDKKVSVHPDMNHPEPIGPHWDYTDRRFGGARVHPDGRITPK